MMTHLSVFCGWDTFGVLVQYFVFLQIGFWQQDGSKQSVRPSWSLSRPSEQSCSLVIEQSNPVNPD